MPLSLGTPGSSPAPEATLERGAPRDKQAKAENYMALLSCTLPENTVCLLLLCRVPPG
jgi:hypothetical protein